MNANIWNIGWFGGSYAVVFSSHTYNNKKINKSLFIDERNRKIISASTSIPSKCLKLAQAAKVVLQTVLNVYTDGLRGSWFVTKCFLVC